MVRKSVKNKVRQLLWQEKVIEGIQYYFAREMLFKTICVIGKVTNNSYECIIGQQDMLTNKILEPKYFNTFETLEEAKKGFQEYFESLVINFFFEGGTQDKLNKGDKSTLELVEQITNQFTENEIASDEFEKLLNTKDTKLVN